MNETGPDVERRVLVLAPTTRDATTCHALLAASGIRAEVCKDLAGLCREALRGAGAAILTQEAILSDRAGCLADLLRGQPGWSEFPLIVLTPAGPESPKTLAALQAVGHMTLMKRPIQVSVLVSTVESALRDRRRQYQARDHLLEREGQAEALRLAKERLAFALDAGQLGAWEFDPGRGRVEATALCKAIFGLPPGAEFSRGLLLDGIHPADRAPVEAALRRSLDEQAEYDVEYRTVWPDGTTRWVMVRGRAVGDGRGQAVRMAGVCFDITERKRAEHQLRESEARFRQLADNLPSGAIYQVIQGPAGDPRFSYFSEGLRDLVGLSPEEVKADPAALYGLVHKDDLPGMRAAEERSLRDRVPFSHQFRMTSRGGMLVWVHARSAPRDLPDGGAIWDGVVFDITERKEAEEKLRESEERYRALAENVPQLSWTCLPDGQCDYLSRQWVEYTGMSGPEQLGLGWLRLVIHPDDQERAFRMWMAAVEDRAPYDLEYRIKGRDGQYRWFKTRGTAIRDDSGRIVKWFGTCTDIDAQVRAEEALREADRRKDEFLAMLAHELRNPLAAVNAAVAVLKRSDDPEHRSWASDVVERQVKQLTRLIDDLLDVSRITTGKIRLKKELIDAGPVLDRAIEDVRPLLDEKGHELVVAMDRGRLPLRADPARLEQIVLNLLTNAAKYTEPGGRIALEATNDGGRVVISVRDNGVGIPAEKLPQMFELFAQGDRTLARSEGGLGIGLTIVKRLTEMHGGTISAKSDGAGRGSEFTVRLPSARARQPDSAPAGEARGPAAKGTRILVIDDNVDTARGMVRLLELLGNDVRAVHDGLAAIDAARGFRPEFILLDIGLPGMDGYQIAEALRDDECCKDSVIIGVSGYGQDEDRRRSKAAGFDHHLVKPVDFDSLVSLLGRSQ